MLPLLGPGTVAKSVQAMVAPLEAFRFPALARIDALGGQPQVWRSALTAATRPPRAVDAFLEKGSIVQRSVFGAMTQPIAGVTTFDHLGRDIAGLTGPKSVLGSTLAALDGPRVAGSALAELSKPLGVSSMLGERMAVLPDLREAISPKVLGFLQAERDRAQVFSHLLDGVRPQIMRLAEALVGEVRELGHRAREAAQAWQLRAYVAALDAQSAAMNGDMVAVEVFFVQWMDLPRRRWRQRL